MTLRIIAPIRTRDNGKDMHIYHNYYKMLKEFDMELILATPGSFETYNKLADICDGLFLPGGDDVDPKFYNQKKHSSTVIEPAPFEQMEFALLTIFTKQKKPILGVCRGIQTINVFFNGTLIQDIPSMRPACLSHQQSKTETYAHKVTIQSETLLGKYVDQTIHVNSYHHQNIDTVAPGFIVSAISEDGLVEGIEKDNIIAVQWHPEKVDDVYQKQIMQAWLATFTGEIR